jgi:hypothetical protein
MRHRRNQARPPRKPYAARPAPRGAANGRREGGPEDVTVAQPPVRHRGTWAGRAGTGMIISRSGLVLTNSHVIDASNGLTATVVSTGRTCPAIWLGYDKGSDIAVVKLEGASGLTPIPLGNSSAVKVGDGVVAMGNANGTGSITTATGAITGLNQAITASDDGSGESAEHLTGMLQTGADIIQGDSGGPLASTADKVIGMAGRSRFGPARARGGGERRRFLPMIIFGCRRGFVSDVMRSESAHGLASWVRDWDRRELRTTAITVAEFGTALPGCQGTQEAGPSPPREHRAVIASISSPGGSGRGLPRAAPVLTRRALTGWEVPARRSWR